MSGSSFILEGESSRPREASDVEESQGVTTPNQPGGDEDPPPEAAGTREVSEDDEFHRMLEVALRESGFDSTVLSEDQLTGAGQGARVANHSPEAASDGEVLANDEIQLREANEVQEEDEWAPHKNKKKGEKLVRVPVDAFDDLGELSEGEWVSHKKSARVKWRDEDPPPKAQVESEDDNLQSREVGEDQGEVDLPVEEFEWMPSKKGKKKGKKGRSAIVLDVKLPLEEVIDRGVLEDDDLQPREPQFGTDLVSAVVIEETVQVDRRSRGKEKKSARFFADKFDSSSPKARSTEEKRQHSGRKSHGYREYSSFLASDADFLIFRKFSTGNVRVLLSLQHQVSKYESALDRRDDALSRNGDVNNGQLEGDDPERQRIVEALHESLSKYNAFLIQVAEITKWPTAEPVNVKSLINWHHIYKGVISDQDQAYIDKTADLCNLVPPDVNPLRRFLDSWNFFMLSPLWQKAAGSDLPVSESPQVIYIEDKRMDRFVLFLTVLIWLTMLIAPLWILYFVAHAIAKLGIITGFIILFLGVVAVLTDSSPSDMLAATAGYAAVIIVFLSFGPNS